MKTIKITIAIIFGIVAVLPALAAICACVVSGRANRQYEQFNKGQK